MSNCTLDQHQEYNLVSVQFDNGTGKYQVHLSNPPTSCPDGFFTSKSATLTVDPNISVSKLTYTNHPVVLVSSRGMVQQVDSTPPSSFGFGTFLVLVLLVGAAFAWYKGWFNNLFNKSTHVSPTPVPDSSTSHVSTFESTPKVEERVVPVAQAPVAQTIVHTYQPAPVVIHDNGSGNFLTGMLVGEALSSGNGYHHDTEIIHEREVVHDHDRYTDDSRQNDRYSSDDNSSSSRYSSDDNSSSSNYSSDSSSSYSSDSSSSYSSDSGSSDSGSFSSDF